MWLNILLIIYVFLKTEITAVGVRRTDHATPL
jgi:hypothetical protein